MRVRSILALGAALAMSLAVAPASAAPVSSGPAHPVPVSRVAAPAAPAQHGPTARLVTTFDKGMAGAFAESMAVARDGTLYVAVTTWSATSWNTGQVYRVTPAGRRTPFGPAITGGLITGLAFDQTGHLFVGLAAWQEPGLPTINPGVFRIDPNGRATRVLTLPNGAMGTAAFPNGLAVHGRYLYVADSVGKIWRTRTDARRVVTPSRPWLSSTVLTASAGHFGLNGITFRGDVLYGVVYDSGLVVRVPVTRRGTPGPLSIMARNTLLKTADGITFDAIGRLWVTATRSGTVGSGALLTVDRTGRVRLVAEHTSWLDYPTQAVFGVTARDRATLYLTNGAFESGKAPTVVALTHVGVRG